ncbi:MAG TPA: xanthine dehydrogenase family protein subunit M [Solirubrobacteraceae bacterium]|nr:xanthine dehydrogenase family protein subunit M [Solirubrobacteraceae bacterium]
MQTPARFEYTRATSVDDAVATLQRLGGDARVVAGGHSLLPMMKLRLANPSHLVDINDLTDLDYIRIEGDEIRIGALTRHVALLKSDILAKHFPVIVDAEKVIADPVVRNRGTIGGSLCQADAAEDLSAAASAAKATVVIRGVDGERVVGMEDFHVGPYMTAVGDGEILTEIRLPLRSGAGSAHEKVERRAGDWAICAVSACLWIDNGTISEAGVALSAVGLTTIHADRSEELLRGKAPSAQLFAQAGQLAAADCSPSSDGRGPVEYKRHLASELTFRALTRAAERCAGRPAPAREVHAGAGSFGAAPGEAAAPATPAPAPPVPDAPPPPPEPEAAAPAPPEAPPAPAEPPAPEPAAAAPPAPEPPAPAAAEPAPPTPQPPDSDDPPRISWRR